jgi:hypothetical protein
VIREAKQVAREWERTAEAVIPSAENGFFFPISVLASITSL